MASYTFKWEHPEANEVFVTGTFDDWGKTEKLDRKGDFFEKEVELPNKDKILYKFVVDGNWTVNSHLPQETDEHNNVNNVLHPHQLGPTTLSSAAPTATTAALAGAVPKESDKSAVPGAFPETPATEPATFGVNPIPATEGAGNPIHLAPGEPVPDPSTLTKNTISSTVGSDEPAAFSVNPIPATEGAGNPIHLAPGEKVPDPSTFTKNTITSAVSSDEPEAFSVNPIPATAGAGNPVHLAPGEKVPEPSSLTANTITSNVHTDQASYEKADAPPGILPLTEAPKEKSDAFSVPPISKNMIPESSLPMGGAAIGETDPGVTLQSAAPTSTTAFLAGQVPLEPSATTAAPEVPEVVKESQEEANVAPEASANPEAVEEKKELEDELKSKVPEEPATSESGLSTGKIAGAVTGGIAAAGAAAAGAAAIAQHHATTAVNEASKTLESSGAVPDVVKESIAKAHTSPEATTNPEAVKEKDAVEAELEKKIKPSEESGEPAPTVTAETSAIAPSASAAHGGLSPNALSSNEPLKSSSEPDGLNAPASAPAVSEATKENVKPETVSPVEPVKNGGPSVTSGLSTVPVAEKTSAAEPATPKKGTAAPATSSETPTSSVATPDSKAEKKKKRRSFFNKLKKIFD